MTEVPAQPEDDKMYGKASYNDSCSPHRNPSDRFCRARHISQKNSDSCQSGESREYRIIRYLQAGAQVEFSETYESGYTKIKDERGREGFVLGRSLVDQAPSFVIAGRLEAEVAKQKETITRLRRDIKALTSQNESAGESVKAVRLALQKRNQN